MLNKAPTSPESFMIEVDAEKESLPAPRIARLGLRVRVPEGLTEQQVVGIERAIKRFPAHDTLVTAPAVELSVVVVRDGAAATREPDEHASA